MSPLKSGLITELGNPNEIIHTVVWGSLPFKDWCKKDAARINAGGTSGTRHAEVRYEGGLCCIWRPPPLKAVNHEAAPARKLVHRIKGMRKRENADNNRTLDVIGNELVRPDNTHGPPGNA